MARDQVKIKDKDKDWKLSVVLESNYILSLEPTQYW